MTERSSPCLIPGVFDTLSAVIAASAGFETLFVSGGAVNATTLGKPDIGLLSVTELATVVSRIADRVDGSLVVDADSGYGGIDNVCRTVQLLERAGASIIQLEDQLAIKPPERRFDRPVAHASEMVDRIKAALDSRRSSTLISAHTDAAVEFGLAEAIERAHIYAEAGADLLFIQSLRTQNDADQVAAQLGGIRPLILHLPNAIDASDFHLERLARQGFSYGLMPHLLIAASGRAMADSLSGVAPNRADFDLEALLRNSYA